ncbi:hypothetical protein VTK56DRAFT_550 [Thermocarpiscus australiensis]
MRLRDLVLAFLASPHNDPVCLPYIVIYLGIVDRQMYMLQPYSIHISTTSNFVRRRGSPPPQTINHQTKTYQYQNQTAASGWPPSGHARQGISLNSQPAESHRHGTWGGKKKGAKTQTLYKNQIHRPLSPRCQNATSTPIPLHPILSHARKN